MALLRSTSSSSFTPLVSNVTWGRCMASACIAVHRMLGKWNMYESDLTGERVIRHDSSSPLCLARYAA